MAIRQSLPVVLLLCAIVLGGTAQVVSAKVVAGERDRVRELVAAEARSLGVSVSLALAVAHAESYFDPKAKSHKGARGVMQIMPATAIGEYGIHPDSLWVPWVNIRIGLHFLRRLLGRYGGRRDLALSYYNGGSRVGDGRHARVLPATYDYVRRVETLERKYRRQISTGGPYSWLN